MFRQIVCGLEFCHIRGISHRDLKVENILISDDGSIKISDFGLSVFCEPSDLMNLNMLVKGPNLNHTTCGTIQYLAPEMIKNTGYDGQVSDIWACGVILFYLLTGRKPFDDQEN